ncbi:MAG TPA: rhodanese-like domain-containing protein [Flavobacteriales bacterium]
MKLITPQELLEWKQSGKPYQLVDIRESYEIEACSMGGESIPMEMIPERLDDLRTDIPVVIHCQSGRRSEAVVRWIETKRSMDNLYSLAGGIAAWNDLMMEAQH